MPIDGTWYNELGSTVSFTSAGTSLTGLYQTAVGDASGEYPLTGYVNDDENPAAGWVVLWSNQFGDSNSVTAWAGQYFPNPDPAQEVLIALWLLRSEVAENANWTATQVGEDIFGRIQGQRPDIADLAAIRPPSHPVIHPL